MTKMGIIYVILGPHLDLDSYYESDKSNTRDASSYIPIYEKSHSQIFGVTMQTIL
jgi:hypothetical protein